MNKVQYRAYLKSDDWKSKRAFKETMTPKRCSICAAVNHVQLHHLFYRSTPEETENSDLRWLCGRCHKLTHELIAGGALVFSKPRNHQSCFALTKHAVKKELGFGMANLFA